MVVHGSVFIRCNRCSTVISAASNIRERLRPTKIDSRVFRNVALRFHVAQFVLFRTELSCSVQRACWFKRDVWIHFSILLAFCVVDQWLLHGFALHCFVTVPRNLLPSLQTSRHRGGGTVWISHALWSRRNSRNFRYQEITRYTILQGKRIQQNLLRLT